MNFNDLPCVVKRKDLIKALNKKKNICNELGLLSELEGLAETPIIPSWQITTSYNFSNLFAIVLVNFQSIRSNVNSNFHNPCIVEEYQLKIPFIIDFIK